LDELELLPDSRDELISDADELDDEYAELELLCPIELLDDAINDEDE